MKVKIKDKQKANFGLNILGEGSIKQTSQNRYSMPILEASGPSHAEGGIPISYQGNEVEIEGNETLYQDLSGDMVVLGNMKIPGTQQKFKNAGKKIADAEIQSTKTSNKGLKLINTKDPFNKYQALAFNAGTVMEDAAKQELKELTLQKEHLANLQNQMLDLAEYTGKSPEEISKMMKNGGKIKARVYKNGGMLPLAKEGDKLPLYKDINERERYGSNVLPGDIRRSITNVANKYGLDEEIIAKLVIQESHGVPGLTSPKGAKGVTQMLPSTAKMYGVSEAELNSKRKEDIDKVIDASGQHFRKLLQQNNNDYGLALAAYNGGQKAVEFVKKETGNPDITGNDWVAFMEQRRQVKPTNDKSAWQNETYNYVKNIQGSPTPLRRDGTMSQDRPLYNPIAWKAKAFGSQTPTSQQTPLSPLATENITEDPQVAQAKQPGGTPFGMLPLPPQKQPTQNEVLHPYLGKGTQGSSQTSTVAKDAKQKITRRNRLGISDILPELSLLGDRPDFVQGQQYDPQLYSPYQVSFQDRLNQNQGTFAALSRGLPANPEALASLAAQKYQSDQQVLGEQFRTNQAIQNDVLNKNIGILNDADLKNISLRDQQFVRQEQAKSNTKARKYQAIESIGSKVAQNKALNTLNSVYENMFGFALNKDNQSVYQGPDYAFDFSNMQAGNQKTIRKVKQPDGSVITEIVESPIDQALDQQKLNKAKQIPLKKWGGLI